MGMRFDIENQLSSAQAFTGAATVSTNSYQKQSAAQDISIGEQMALLIMPTVAAGAGSTHTMEAIQATDSALTAGIDVLASRSIVAADLILGSAFTLPFPAGSMTKQFLGFRNTSTGGATTVTLDVYLMPEEDIPHFKTFPKVVDASV